MKSIGTKFVLVICILAAALLTLLTIHEYAASRRHMEAFVANAADVALQFDLAIRAYVSDELRPEMEQRLGAGQFIPEAMSSSYVARNVFERVRQTHPDYVLKFSADNPRNPLNRASPEEQAVLDEFRRHPERSRWVGRLRLGDRDYWAVCVPRRMQPSCLQCHGRPEDAPRPLVAKYGTTAGFHRTVGEVAAIDMVAMPLAKVDGLLVSQARQQVVTLLVGMSVLLTAVVLAFRYLVGRRLAAIARHFRSAAQQGGDLATATIPVQGTDEIGVVAASFNSLVGRLRVLYESLEQRVRQRTVELEGRIADHSAAEAALRDSEKRYRLLAQNVRDVIWTTDLEFRWTYISPSNESLTGYSAEEAENLPFDQLLAPESAQRARQLLSERLAAAAADPRVLAESATVEAELRRKDGGTVWVEINASFLLSGDGTPVGLVGVTRDITARRGLQGQLEQAKEFAEAANRAKSSFLANMSHEIRTPMTAILGYAEMLAETTTAPQTVEAVQAIQRNGEHLLGIINGILDLSKIEAGKLVADVGPCAPRAIVAEVAALMRVRAHAKHMPLTVEYAGPIPQTIQSDATRLRQILINLVGNAIKFTDTGRVRLAVRLLADDPASPRLQFQVIDTGIGIRPDEMQKLFQPFSQLHGAVDQAKGGTGLGLAISRRLAAMLGGDIQVESVPGKGSTFTLTIATGSLDGVALLDAPAEPATGVPPELPEPPLPAGPLGGRVLLAEDGPDNQRLLSCLLRRAGTEVAVCENGRDACEQTLAAERAGQPFDVILMDMQMPLVDGYEATKRLRAESYSRPIVALTAHAMNDDRQKCLDAGCDDYLSKPIDRRRLLATLARYIAPAAHPTAP